MKEGKTTDWFRSTGPWSETIALVTSGIVLVLIAHFVFSLQDNLPGALAMYAGAFLFALAVARRWSYRHKYAAFAISALAGFLVFTVLHNVFEGLYAQTTTGSTLAVFYQVMSVTSFLIGILGMPAFFVLGIMGLLVTAEKETPVPPP